MKKLLLGIFTCLCALIMVSCSSNTPTGKAKAHLDAWIDGNYAEIVEQFHYKTEKTAEDKAKLAQILEEKVKKSIDKKGAMESYEIVSETISEDGTTAKVECLVKYAGGEVEKITVNLVNIDGNWLVESGK